MNFTFKNKKKTFKKKHLSYYYWLKGHVKLT